MSNKEKKELEKKAKQVIKELNGMQGKKGDGKKKTSGLLKGVIAVLAIMVVGAGIWVGIQLLGEPGSQEVRKQAAGADFTCTQEDANQHPAC